MTLISYLSSRCVGPRRSDLPLPLYVDAMELDMKQMIAFSRLSHKLANIRAKATGKPEQPPPDGRFRTEKLSDLDLECVELDEDVEALRKQRGAASGGDLVGTLGFASKEALTYSAETQARIIEQLKRSKLAASAEALALSGLGSDNVLKEFGLSNKITQFHQLSAGDIDRLVAADAARLATASSLTRSSSNAVAAASAAAAGEAPPPAAARSQSMLMTGAQPIAASERVQKYLAALEGK